MYTIITNNFNKFGFWNFGQSVWEIYQISSVDQK